MGLIEEIRQHQEYIKFINDLRDGTAVLDWEWETDIEKMNFTKLRSSVQFDEDSEVFLKKVDQRFAPDNIDQFLVEESTKNLILFIQQGNKIIPPMGNIDTRIKDGEKVDEYFYSRDGFHRMNLSYLLKKKEIPILCKKRISEYSFTLGEWTFKEVDGKVIAEGKTTVEFKADDYYLGHDINKLVFSVK